MLIQDRIKSIMASQALSSSAFADKIGVNRASVSHVLSGRNKPSLDFLSKLLISFPNVNAAWLITGEAREEQRSVSAAQTEGGTGSVKEIERVVCFYSDGTFNSYRPSD